MNKSLQDAVSNITGVNNPKEVNLNDKIMFGCNNCGNCCLSPNVRLSPFDLYNMFKNDSDLKNKLDDCFYLYFGGNMTTPLIGIENGELSMCRFLKVNNNGDFVCSLNKSMPMSCRLPILATGVNLDYKLFDFVPFDEEIKKFDFDEAYKSSNIDNARIFYLEELNNNMCKCNNKKEIKVSEYLKERIKYDKEIVISEYIPLLVHKYIDVEKMIKILYLSEHSEVNIGKAFGTDGKLIKGLFYSLYFYFDSDSKESFFEQSIKHIEKLEDTILPLYRALYKGLYKLYGINKLIFDDILNTEDEELSQKKFDNYFEENKEIIKEKFINDIIPEMLDDKIFKDIKDIN